VAALDYLQNVLNLLKKPIVIEEEKTIKLAEKAVAAGPEGAEETTPGAKRVRKGRIFVSASEDRSQEKLSSKLSSKKAKPIRSRFVVKGAALASGMAAGKAFHYRDILTRELEIYDLTEDQVEAEWGRILRAIEKVEKDLTHVRKGVQREIGSKQAAIFDVHKTILKDLGLLKEIEKELKDRQINAEQVVRDVFKRWEKKLKIADTKEIQEKADDIADIGRRLLRVLIGIEGNVLSKLPYNSILFAKRLLPSDTVYLDRKKTLGIVTEEGGRTSHAAVLARALRVPMVSKIDTNLDRVPQSAPTVIDGDKGTVIVYPKKSELIHFGPEMKKRLQEDLRLAKRLAKTPLKIQGRLFTVKANVASPEEIVLAKKYGCDGVGLYRIESLYMSSTSMLSEDYLYEVLAKALKPVQGKEITLRLLDLGGDKTLPYLDLNEKIDSPLGLRGVRLLLKFPNLLETQIRVCLRLSARFKIKVLVPMVSLPEDMTGIRKILDQEKEKLKAKKQAFNEKIPLGAMIETPSAILALEDLIKASDFLSIGTNDLLQYTMAADREKANVASYYEAGNRLILKWLKEIVEKAAAAGIDCELCGELAGNLEFTEELVKCGLEHYSVTPHLIPRIKNKIKSLNTGMNVKKN
jgi:phosphotransferase system enzyme I (PtsI)